MWLPLILGIVVCLSFLYIVYVWFEQEWAKTVLLVLLALSWAMMIAIGGE